MTYFSKGLWKVQLKSLCFVLQWTPLKTLPTSAQRNIFITSFKAPCTREHAHEDENPHRPDSQKPGEKTISCWVTLKHFFSKVNIDIIHFTSAVYLCLGSKNNTVTIVISQIY